MRRTRLPHRTSGWLLLPYVSLVLLAGCKESPPHAVPAPDPTPPGQVELTPAPTDASAAVVEPLRPRPTPPPVVLPDGWTSITRDAVTVGLSPDGAWLLAGDLGGHTAFWERSSGRFKWADLAKSGRIRHVACAESADRCWSSGFDGAEYPLRGYQLEPLESTGLLGNEGHDARAIAVNPDGTLVSAIITSVDGRHRLMTFATDTKRLIHEVDAGPHNGGHLTWIPGTSMLVRTLVGGGFEVHDTTKTNEPIVVQDDAMKFEAISASITAEGNAVIVGSNGTSILHLHMPLPPSAAPTISKKVVLEDERFAVRNLHRVSDGRVVAVTRPTSGGLVFWDAGTGKPLADVRTVCPCETHALAFDGKTAACKCADRSEIRHGPSGVGAAVPTPTPPPGPTAP